MGLIGKEVTADATHDLLQALLLRPTDRHRNLAVRNASRNDFGTDM
jgi:hypothetical protein